MTSKRNNPVLNRKLIAILDDLIQEGHWDKSLFLQATEKEIVQLKNKLSIELDLSHEQDKQKGYDQSARLKQSATLPDDQMHVYVMLYQSNGLKIAKWETALEGLLAQSISRPIYRDETKAKDMLVKKGNSLNNAYVTVVVNKSDVVPLPEKHVTDQFGHELVTLKEGALKLNRVVNFVHSSGTYIYKENHLVKIL